MNQKITTFALSIFAIIIVSVFNLSADLAPIYQVKAVETKPIEWSGNTEIKGWTDASSERIINCTSRIDSYFCKQCKNSTVGLDCCLGADTCVVILDTSCTTGDGKPC